jgi:hypothetical protein
MPNNFAFHTREVVDRRFQHLTQQAVQAPVQPSPALQEQPVICLSADEIERVRSIFKLLDNLRWMFSTLRLWFLYMLAGIGFLLATWDSIEKLLKKIAA